MEVRLLQADDLAAYREIQRLALENHPEAFGMSVAEFDALSDEQALARLTIQLPDNGTIGAFIDSELVGMIGIGRHHRTKTRHRGIIGNMYVTPNQRGQRIGQSLLDAGIAHLRNLDGIKHIVLAVTTGNRAARGLYRSSGFVTWGIDPDYICVDEQYYDIEWMILRL